RPITARDRVLELAGLQIVEVKVAPAAAFRVPDELVRLGQITPARAALAGFELRRALFVIDLSNVARVRVGNAQILDLVVTRGRDKCERAAVIRPVNIAPAAVTSDIVALCRAVCV